MKRKPPIVPAACLVVTNLAQTTLLWGKACFTDLLGETAYGRARLAAALAVIICAAWTGIAIYKYTHGKNGKDR